MNTTTSSAPAAAPSSSISDAKLAANRENAQKSTGPKTEEGKAVSSRNNFRHGFTGIFTVLPGEDAEAFQAICHSLTEEHRPQTANELMLVNDVARHYWLTQRALSLQEHVIEATLTDPAAEKKLALYMRYQTTHQRAYHKCLKELRDMRREADIQANREALRNAAAAVGFESQNRKAASAPASALPQTNREIVTPEPASRPMQAAETTPAAA